MEKMKRVLFMLLMAAVCCGNAMAQKGMQGIGINVGYNHGMKSIYGTYGLEHPGGFGVGFKYQYNISNYLRIEPSFMYYTVKSEDEDGWWTKKEGVEMTGMVNADFFFTRPQKLRPYVFAGIGWIGYKHYYENEYDFLLQGCFGGDAGLGLDWRLSSKVSLQAEGGILLHQLSSGWVDDVFQTLKFNVGLAYNF